MDDSASDDDSDCRLRIENIPFFDIGKLRAYLAKIKPDKRTIIMSGSPSGITKIALQDYPAQTLKGLLSYFKAKYDHVRLGGIEEHGTKSKPVLINELLSAIGKIKIYNDQQE